MFDLLIVQAWPYLALIAAAIAVFIGVRQSGKAAARTEDAAKLNKQAAKAQEVVRNVDNKINALDDDAVDSRLDKWVRGPKGGG